MPLPDIHDIYIPILDILRDGAPHNLAVNDLMNKASEYFDIGELSSIDRNKFKQRITHARDELKQKKFLTSPSKNTYIITAAGLDYLNNPEESEPAEITQPEVIESEPEPEPESVAELPELESVPELEEESSHELESEAAHEPELVPEIEAVPEVEPEAVHEPEAIPEVKSEVEPEPEPSEVYEEIQETEEPVSQSEEYEEQPDIPDESEVIAEVQDEADDIQLEDEPVEHADDIVPDEAPEAPEEDITLEDEPIEPSDDISPEEAPEATEEDITLEDEPELESEQYGTPSEGEDIAEAELEPESEPEEEYESESHEPNEDDTNEMNTMNENNSAGIEDAIRIHNEELAEKVLSEMLELSPEMFEVFVVDMLSKMGYRAFHNARYTPNEAGSNMIHGVIIDDKTGAPIYIHARKTSQNKTIGRADMQDFIDALSDKGGKGVFATTAKFSEQAEILANDERIMLIDGMKLAGLMIAHDFCVKVEKVYEIKGLDTESFSEYKR